MTQLQISVPSNALTPYTAQGTAGIVMQGVAGADSGVVLYIHLKILPTFPRIRATAIHLDDSVLLVGPPLLHVELRHTPCERVYPYFTPAVVHVNGKRKNNNAIAFTYRQASTMNAIGIRSAI